MHHTLILSIAVVAVTVAVFAASALRLLGKLALLGLLFVVLFAWIEPEATEQLFVRGHRAGVAWAEHGKRAVTGWLAEGLR